MQRYREFSPPSGLAPHVLCLWQKSGGGASLIVPDGCADIIWIDDNPPVLVGPATRSKLARLSATGRAFGVRFQPGAAGSALGLPLTLVLDQTLLLDDVWGHRSRMLDPVADSTAEGDWQEAAAALARVLRPVHAVDRRIKGAVDWLARHPTCRCTDLENDIGISARQLRRLFLAETGYGPKTLQRILRFQRAIALRATTHSLACLAQAAGYADQAHMSREVRQLTGQSPTAVLPACQGGLGFYETFQHAVAMAA